MTLTEHTRALVAAYGEHRPEIAATAWIAPHAIVIGAVTLAERVSIWYGASIRAEAAPVRIGAGTNVQDNCVLHTDPGAPLTIGADVTIGHGAIVHGCRIEDAVLIGMGAIVMNGAVIGTGSVLAAGAVVPQGAVIPARSLVAGVPGRVKRDLDDRAVQVHIDDARHYAELARRHRDAMELT